ACYHFQCNRFSTISRGGVKGSRQTHGGGVGCSIPSTEIHCLVIGVLERHNAAVVKIQSGNVLGGWSPGCGLACGDELPGRQWAVGDINVSEGQATPGTPTSQDIAALDRSEEHTSELQS